MEFVVIFLMQIKYTQITNTIMYFCLIMRKAKCTLTTKFNPVKEITRNIILGTSFHPPHKSHFARHCVRSSVAVFYLTCILIYFFKYIFQLYIWILFATFKTFLVPKRINQRIINVLPDMCPVFFPNFNQRPSIYSAGFNEVLHHKISRKSVKWESLFHVNRRVTNFVIHTAQFFYIPYFNQQNELIKMQ
jgi:hypothetical protein